MVHGSAQIRQQGAMDFMAYYEYICASQDMVPVFAVTVNLDKGLLDFNGDRVKQMDWPPILNSISINKHLQQIRISSTHHASHVSRDTDIRHCKFSIKKKVPAICSKDLTYKLCKSLRDCLAVSPSLKALHLNGLPLRERDLITLTKGLSLSNSLEMLSLANCPISDDGLEIICQSVKYSACIRTVDFTGCNLTWRGAEHMANIIKHQAVQRHGSAWAESLRYRQPQFEGMGGLRRITLNNNSLIGDRGAKAIAQELAEDLWVKAVDLHKCGLSNDGARRLLEALKTNSALCVLDIRCNPLVDKVLIKTVIEKILMNSDGQPSEFCWIVPKVTEPVRTSGPKRRASASKGRPTCKMAPRRELTSSRSTCASPPQKQFPFCGHIPWRTAARAGRQRGLPPGGSCLDPTFQGPATVKITVESDSEGDEETEDSAEKESRPSLPSEEGITRRQFQRLQMELRECRLRLSEERTSRLKAESKLIELELENDHLRSTNKTLSEAMAAASSSPAAPEALSALEDEAVLESIESSFNKFHAFLDLLKDAGLGQLASIAGIDQSDFQPLGKPQLSSTFDQPLKGEDTLVRSGEELPYVPAKSDSKSLMDHGLPAPAGGQADITPIRSAGPEEESEYIHRLLNDALTNAGGHVPDSHVHLKDGSQTPPSHHHLRPDSLPDLDPEHCFHRKQWQLPPEGWFPSIQLPIEQQSQP